MVRLSIVCHPHRSQFATRGQRTPMTTPFSSQDLGRIFDARTITRGRSLGLAGRVEVQLEGDTITAIVQDSGVEQNVRITPSLLGRRVVFDHHCTCRIPGCAHLAAAALAALDRFPSLRKPEQQTFLDLLAAAPEQERQRTVFELAPGEVSICLRSIHTPRRRAYRHCRLDHAAPDRRR